MTSNGAHRPLLTAGVTAYNAADTIERAVNSALTQTWQPLEILIVDDGSTDSTRDILARLEADHPQIRVVLHDDNQGTAAGRNTLIEHAHGDAIAFFDDDDISHPDRVGRQWERLIAYERQYGDGAPVLCHASRTVVYPDGTRDYRRAMGSVESRPGPHGQQLADHLLFGGPLRRGDRGVAGTCAQIGRLSTYQQLGGFDERCRRSQDAELNVRLARAGGHLIGSAEPLVEQHVTPTHDKRLDLRLEMDLLLLHTHRDAFPNHRTYTATRLWWEAKYAWMGGRQRESMDRLLRATVVAPRVTGRRMATEAAPRLGAKARRATARSRR